MTRMMILGIDCGEMEGNVEYCGDDFTQAQKASKQSGLPIYEHNDRRGYFIVADADRYGLGYLRLDPKYSEY
jgi:hypothetical protein